MHIFHQSPSSARYSFYQPMEGWKAESTCRQWGLNLPLLAQESDALLTELSWPAIQYNTSLSTIFDVYYLHCKAYITDKEARMTNLISVRPSTILFQMHVNHLLN